MNKKTKQQKRQINIIFILPSNK